MNTNEKILLPIAEKVINGIISIHKEELRHLRKLKRGEDKEEIQAIPEEPKKIVKSISEHILSKRPTIDLPPDPPTDSIPAPTEPLPAKYKIYDQAAISSLMRVPPSDKGQ